MTDRLAYLKQLRAQIDNEIRREERARVRLARLANQVEKTAGGANAVWRDRLFQTSCSYFGVDPVIVRAGRRDRASCHAKWVYWWILRQEKLSYPTIAKWSALDHEVDHTTVMHGVAKVDADDQLQWDAAVIREALVPNLAAS